jgi:adenylate cyclase
MIPPKDAQGVIEEGRRTLIPTMSEIIEWLAGDECYTLDGARLATELGRRLRAIGLPLDHLGLYLRTLHPEIRSRTIAWTPDGPVQIHDRQYGVELSPAFRDNPIRSVLETQKPLVLRVNNWNEATWAHIDIFEGRQLVELVILPLRNADALPSAVSFATARNSGFTATERAAFVRIAPALRNACELRTLRSAEQALLDTYVGAATARRVLKGRIRRGEVETLEAALMLCDLRGFTELSNRLTSERVLQLLDTYFDCVMPAINAAGGEVIKFMGDAVLAFFHREDASSACSAGLQGALSALESLRKLAISDAELRAGVALHYGKVSYGNIGYGHRLDFTLIGPDVNLVSRLQGICSTTGLSLLMSERFAEFLDPTLVTAIGPYQLKGFAEPAELYTLGSTRMR